MKKLLDKVYELDRAIDKIKELTPLHNQIVQYYKDVRFLSKDNPKQTHPLELPTKEDLLNIFLLSSTADTDEANIKKQTHKDSGYFFNILCKMEADISNFKLEYFDLFKEKIKFKELKTKELTLIEQDLGIIEITNTDDIVRVYNHTIGIMDGYFIETTHNLYHYSIGDVLKYNPSQHLLDYLKDYYPELLV